MQKLFGEYLVDKKIIQEEQLLGALIEQLEATPPIAKIVRDMELLKSEDILKCIKEQTFSASSFIDAAKKLQLWNDALSQKIISDLETKRIPLGELLVKKNALDLSTLTKALDDYFAEKEADSNKNESKTVESLDANAKNNSGGGKYPEIFSFFNADFFQCTQDVIVASSDEKLTDTSVFSKLADILHQIGGATKLYDYTELFPIVEKVESIVRLVTIKPKDKIEKHMIKNLKTFLESSKAFFESLNENYQNGSLEQGDITDGKISNHMKAIMDSLILVEFDLNTIETELAS